MKSTPILMPLAVLILSLCTACRDQAPQSWAAGSVRYGPPLGPAVELTAPQLTELSKWVAEHRGGWDHAPSGTPEAADQELIQLDLSPEHGQTATYSIYGRTDGSFYALAAIGSGMQWRFQGYGGHLAAPHAERALSTEDLASLRRILREREPAPVR